jgi:tRNA(Ile)-lysidine synthase TilS/MesJ
LHGKHHTIPLRHANVVRPFLTTPKREFVSWCERKNVPWCEDSSNQDTRYMRNLIRHRIVPEALIVNPGLHTVVKKMVEDQIKGDL